ncbi:hypothetical protein TNCV_3026721 [Trichonephila clavipes]|nr:hypothetical protein TNCV_3026721 [Trichonephila clavipes]
MEHILRLVSSALFSYRYDRLKADRVQTLRAHWSMCSAMGVEFLLRDDNARPHRANIVDEFLQSEDITRMD